MQASIASVVALWKRTIRNLIPNVGVRSAIEHGFLKTSFWIIYLLLYAPHLTGYTELSDIGLFMPSE